MKMKVEITGKLDFPAVDFTNDLDKIASSIVIPLIKEGILTATDIRGNSFPELSSATVRRKGHSRPLQDTGELYRSFNKSVVGKHNVVVFIASGRNKIAEYLQIEGVGKARKQFKFMGVTEGMEKDANNYMKKVVIKWIANANR